MAEGAEPLIGQWSRWRSGFKRSLHLGEGLGPIWRRLSKEHGRKPRIAGWVRLK